jgi:manganese transport protein
MHKVVRRRDAGRPPVLPWERRVDLTKADPPPRRTTARSLTLMLGPAFVAAVAYVDPGNFATNFSAGARLGYALVWVVVLSNLIAMLVQYESAKLGVATGRDLPEVCREQFPRAVTRGLWVQAELVTMATDVAEFVGAAVGLNLLFGIPMFPAGLITAVVAFGVLELSRRGHRPFELAIAGLLGIVLLGLVYDLLVVGTDASGVASGLVPGFGDAEAVVLAAGIVGATVMPHVIYLHSALTKSRNLRRDDDERRAVLRYFRIDVVLALSVAGLVNLAMVCVAASLFGGEGGADVDGIVGAHDELGRLAGGGAALVFAVALLASGLSSSSVGTYAGQVVMQGFLRRRIPLFLRRALTMLPALLILALGLPVTASLIVSQVVLSFGIPFALIPLSMLTARRDVMGALVNRRSTSWAMWLVTAAISALNIYLIVRVVTE